MVHFPQLTKTEELFQLKRRLKRPGGFPGGASGKEPPANAGNVRDMGAVPGLGRSLEEGMATHAGILASIILWKEEPGGLQSIWLQRI